MAATLPGLMCEVFRRTVAVDSVDAALDESLDVLEQGLQPTWCAIWLFDVKSDTWFISHSRGLSAEAAELRFARGSAIPCLVGERGVTRRYDTLDKEQDFQRVVEEHYRMRSALYVPMTTRGRPVGVIALYSESESHFDDQDQLDLGLVAAHLSNVVTALGMLEHRDRVRVMDARDRLARGLHDGMLQMLSSVRLYAHSCRDALAEGDVAEAEALLDLLVGTTASAVSEVRSAISSLRSVELLRTLQWMLQRSRTRLEAVGITVELPSTQIELSPTVSDALAAVALEATNNVIKHSGATWVRFSLGRTGDRIVFECLDDGRGEGVHLDDDAGETPVEVDGDPGIQKTQGVGFRMLTERLGGLGGELVHFAPPNGGYVIRCELPTRSE